MNTNPASLIRRTFFMFAPFALLLLVFIFLYDKALVSAKLNELKISELHSLGHSENAIKRIVRSTMNDLMILASSQNLKADHQDWRLLEEEFLSFSRFNGVYDQIRFIDESGMERVRINDNSGNPSVVPSADLQFKGKRYYFTDCIGLSSGDVFVSPLDLNVEQGKIELPLKPMIRFGTPVFNSAGDAAIGIVLINLLGKEIIRPLEIAHADSLGDYMLLNLDGYWLKGASPEDEWGFMYADRKDIRFDKQYPKAWEEMAGHAKGQFKNEEGLFTFFTIYPLQQNMRSSTGNPEVVGKSEGILNHDEYNWKLVSHVSPVVLSDRIRPIRLRIVIATGVLLFMFAIFTLITAVSRIKLRAISTRINVLEGILPTCQHCKNIRVNDADEDNPESWVPIERYIGEHSEAHFSHGICPNCMKERYADVLDAAD